MSFDISKDKNKIKIFLFYYSGRDRVDPKKYFLKNRDYLIKTHKELNRLNVSDIDTEIFDCRNTLKTCTKSFLENFQLVSTIG